MLKDKTELLQEIELTLSEGVASLPMKDEFHISYTAVQNKIGEIVWQKIASIIPAPTEHIPLK